MQCSKSLLLVIFSFLSVFQLQAQTNPAQSAPPPQSNQESQPQELPAPSNTPAATPDNEQQPAESSSAARESHPTEQDRVRLAREAQERVRARRQQRLQATIQDTYSHKFDVYFGYAYLRVRPGPNLQHATEYGWNAGATRYFNPKLGVTLDFRGYYTNAFTGNGSGRPPAGIPPDTTTPVQGLFNPFISNYAVQLGPHYAVRQRKNYAIGGQVLAGVTRNLFYANSSGLSGTLVGLYPNATKFTLTAMAPFDYNLGPGLAVRVAPTYNLTTWGGAIQHNLGFTLGLNYRFGRQ